MKKALFVLSLAGAALSMAAPQARAQATSSTRARWYDVQRLQDDLAVLDDSLASVPTSNSRYREFQDRANALHDDVSRLRDDMQHSSDTSYPTVSAADVSRVRTSVHDLQKDIDTALNRRWTSSGSMVLPEGTAITVRLERALSSRTARLEDRVDATVVRPVYVDNRMVVPAGARVRGTVTDAQPAQRPARGGRLNITFDRLLLDDGTSVDLRSRVAHVSEDVGHGDTAKRAGIGAALGGILGGVIGGGKGAVVGVLLGGAGGAITSEGNDVELPEGTVFELQLDGPATLIRR